MTRRSLRRLSLALLAAPLAMGLAACGDKGDGAAGLSGEPIAKVAAPAGKSWTEVIEKTPEGGYRMGNPDAPIKLVEFGALSCSHCAHFSEEASQEIANTFVASGRVSYELRLFLLNPYDLTASLLATCGTSEAVIPLSEQFWAWQPNMFKNLDNADPAQMKLAESQPPEQRFLTLANVSGMTQFFASRGISVDQGKACLSDTAKANEIVNHSDEAGKEYDITGTPSFLINGKKLDVNTWAEIKTRLENLGAR
jgi:protein-disulfide isomerase